MPVHSEVAEDSAGVRGFGVFVSTIATIIAFTLTSPLAILLYTEAHEDLTSNPFRPGFVQSIRLFRAGLSGPVKRKGSP